MRIKEVELETVCGITSTLPQHDVLEVAFWGRSNVGKSSLLNSVWGRKNLARTSSEPGKTQTINYYKAVLSGKTGASSDTGAADSTSGASADTGAADSTSNASSDTGAVESTSNTSSDTGTGELYMVDLPGYGYAKTSRETAKKWMTMIRKYLENSQALRVVFLLIDSRHDPTEKDIEQFRLLFSLGFNPLIIATKVDKLKKNEKAKHIAAIRRILTSEAARIMGPAPTDSDEVIEELPVIPFSATTGEGRDEILEYLDYFINNIML